MLCDGRMVCGCADPYGHRVLGDVRVAPVHPVNAIWTGTTIRTLREELNAGGSKFCGDCPLKLPLKKDDLPREVLWRLVRDGKLKEDDLPRDPVHAATKYRTPSSSSRQDVTPLGPRSRCSRQSMKARSAGRL